VAEIDPRPETHAAAASRASRRNRLIDRPRIEGPAVARRPEGPDIEGRKLIACERQRATCRTRRSTRRNQPGGGYSQKLSSANVHAWSRVSYLWINAVGGHRLHAGTTNVGRTSASMARNGLP
jgi:hypothetical protein